MVDWSGESAFLFPIIIRRNNAVCTISTGVSRHYPAPHYPPAHRAELTGRTPDPGQGHRLTVEDSQEWFLVDVAEVRV